MISKLFGLGSLFSQMPKSTDNTLRKAAVLVDALYTSDEEKLDRQAALARIISRGDALQTQLNTIEGSHRSLLVSGWRPLYRLGLRDGAGVAFSHPACGRIHPAASVVAVA